MKIIKSQTQANSWTNRQKVTQSSMKTTLRTCNIFTRNQSPLCKNNLHFKDTDFNLSIK